MSRPDPDSQAETRAATGPTAVTTAARSAGHVMPAASPATPTKTSANGANGLKAPPAAAIKSHDGRRHER